MSKVVDPKKEQRDGPELAREAARVRSRRLYSQTGADWQYRVDFDRLRQGAAGQAAGRDEGRRPRRAGAVRRARTSATPRLLSGQLEIQHQYPLRGRSGRRKADAVRDRRAPTCSARRSTCRGWKAASVPPSPGSGRKAPCRTWPAAWPTASSKCSRSTAS